MTDALPIIAVVLVSLATLVVGVVGLRISRTTSDFYVASRAVGPAMNASAISGEYLSAASFLGVAGLVLLRGADMLWYPVGWTAGYLFLLVFVAAPLRRSRAYTLPDFAEFRLESLLVRRTASLLVVLIGVLYLVPQFQGAGLTLRTLTGAPTWLGEVVVSLVVLINVASGGMRSITIAQAFQYWLKLTALFVPIALIVGHWTRHGDPTPRLAARAWLEPMQGPYAAYLTYSLILATFLGTMGLPHVVVRFYTNRDGHAARRTTLAVLAMLSAFYLLPPLYGVLGRVYSWDLVLRGRTDSVVLELPGRVLGGGVGDVLTALLAAGAFAAFLSTSSGLVLSVGGVIGQDLRLPRLGAVASFRTATLTTAVVTLLITLLTTGLAVAHAVELAFAVAASTFCPLLLLGIWWRGLTAAGALAGLLVGGGSSLAAVLAVMIGAEPTGAFGAVVSQPALCTVPLSFSTMVVVSVLTATHLPAHVVRTMVRLHAPEAIELDRGSYHPEGSRR